MLQAEQILQNRYQLKQILGDNAARQTWLAIDLQASENSYIVIKFLSFGGQIQWDNLKLFEREAQVLKQLNHPCIPKYCDYFSIDDRLLWFGLVEEYIPGTSFKDLLTQGKRFTEKQVRKIASDVLKILIYLHELNPSVLHRDIKPSNLILDEDEQVYLVDFGAVQDKVAKEGVTFTVVGTYGYAPMEQFGGRAVPASDLYALGATLIHLLTGIAPAELPQQDLRIQFSDKVSISSSFVNWIEKLTEPAPERRFSTARQALSALEQKQINSASAIKIAKGKIFQVPATQISLYKSLSRLEINIPSRGIKTLADLGRAGLLAIVTWLIIVVMPVFSLSFIILLILFAILLKGIEYLFGNTKINFNRNKFEIKKQLFNLTYLTQNAVTPHIQDVSLEYDSRFGLQPIGITITLGPYLKRFIRYSFGRTLTETELIWLAQEIREWLETE